MNTVSFTDWKNEFEKECAEWKARYFANKFPEKDAERMAVDIQRGAYTNLAGEEADIETWEHYDNSCGYKSEFRDSITE